MGAWAHSRGGSNFELAERLDSLHACPALQCSTPHRPKHTRTPTSTDRRTPTLTEPIQSSRPAPCTLREDDKDVTKVRTGTTAGHDSRTPTLSLHRGLRTLILTEEHPLCPSTFLRRPETLNRRAAASVDMLTEGLTRYFGLPVSSTGAEPSTRPAVLAGASRGWACVSSLGSSPGSAVRAVRFASVPCSGLAFRPAAKALRTFH